MRKTYCFDKAQYVLGDRIVISSSEHIAKLNVRILSLNGEVNAKVSYDKNRIILDGVLTGNYGVVIEDETGKWEGAFDVVLSNRDCTRYGFLSDFSDDDENDDDVLWMKNLHINAIQFYDWMYRHDDLIPKTDYYDDPLGRKMSAKCLKNKIDSCKKNGIRPFAYGAVYAATKDTFNKHPEWGMYTLDSKPLVFANWLNFMNISKDNAWSEHIVNEYRKAVDFGFEGIHMDTYGFPKYTYDFDGKPIELEKEFPCLINKAADAVKDENENAGVIFNAVNNWPVETVAKSKQDSVYIEVWPPHVSYYDLFRLIKDAKNLSGKQVVLAAYIKPFLEEDYERAMNALRFSLASILSSGGTQLVFGENMAVLRDSYYANYANLHEKSEEIVQKYCDYIVMYAELLYFDTGMDVSNTSLGGINEDICVFCDREVSTQAKGNAVWAVSRKKENRISINLINLCGNDNGWNEKKNNPEIVKNLTVKVRLDRAIKEVCMASPDGDSIMPVKLDFSFEKTTQGRVYTVNIPILEYWDTVWFETEE